MPTNPATLDDALQHWNAAKTLIGHEAAAEMFEKIVDVAELVRSLDPKRNPDMACSLLEWMYHNVEKKDEYRALIVNMSLDQALESLKHQQLSTFFSRLENAARMDSDLRDVVRKLRSLGDTLMRRVIRETEQHAIGMAIKEVRPDMYAQILLRTLMAFANSDLPYGFGPEHVSLVLDEVLMAVTEDLRKS